MCVFVCVFVVYVLNLCVCLVIIRCSAICLSNMLGLLCLFRYFTRVLVFLFGHVWGENRQKMDLWDRKLLANLPGISHSKVYRVKTLIPLLLFSQMLMVKV